MASRISQRSRRSSRSLSRFTLTLAIGTAAPARIPMIVMAMISSISEKPTSCWPRFHETLNLLTILSIVTLAHTDGHLRSHDRNRLLCAVSCSRTCDAENRISGRLGLPGDRKYRSIAGHPLGPRRTSRRRHQQAIVIAVRQGNRLIIPRQQLARGDIHQLQMFWIVADLYR